MLAVRRVAVELVIAATTQDEVGGLSLHRDRVEFRGISNER